jgi:hypothetical protein
MQAEFPTESPLKTFHPSALLYRRSEFRNNDKILIKNYNGYLYKIISTYTILVKNE